MKNQLFVPPTSTTSRKQPRRLAPWALLSVLLAFVFVFFAPSALAQTTWWWRNDGGLTGAWGDSGRWWVSSATTLANGSSQDAALTMDGTAYTTQTNTVTGASVRSLIFNSGRSSTTIGGNTLFVSYGGTGKIENNSGNTQTINMTISNATANGLEINAVSGALNMNNVYLGTNFVDLWGTSTLTFNGVVSGSAVVTWKASGKVVFGASNNLTSNFNLQRGYLVLSNASATVGTGQINIGETGNDDYAELQLGAGAAQTNAIANNIVFNKPTGTDGSKRAINSVSTSGTNVITGTIQNTNTSMTARLSVANGGTLQFSNVVSGAGGFYLDEAGGGTLELSAANTFSGGLYVDKGTVKLSGSTATAGTGVFQLGKTSGASDAALLFAGTSGGITANNSTLTVNSASGARTILSENTTGTNKFTGSVDLAKALTISNASGGELQFTGVMSNTGTLTKTGGGVLALSGANTFTGATTISAGTLQLNASGGSALGSTASLTVGSGATLLISKSDQVNNSAGVTLSGGTIKRDSGVSEVFGNLNLTAASSLNYGSGTAGTLTFGTYTPSALLTVNNFFEGNKLVFSSNLSSQVTNGSYFTFDNGFTSNWNGSTFTITAIPEASTVAAALGLTGLLLWPSRRRLVKDAKSILGLRRPARERLAKR